MTHDEVRCQHAAVWTQLFATRGPEVQAAAAGLVEQAADLYAMCWALRRVIERSGVIKVHPEHPELQRPVPAVREYARLAESYAAIVNKLTRLLGPGEDAEADELDEYR